VVGKGGEMPSGEWTIIHSQCVDGDYGSARDVDLTGASGTFNLSVWTCAPPDSLAAAVVSPDTLIVGDSVVRETLNYSTMVQPTSHWEEGSGCDDGTNVESHYESGYAYSTIRDVTIKVPE
jgi:hypothetical protein